MIQSIYFLSFLLFFGVSSISIKNHLDNDILYILIDEETFQINLIENSVTKELLSILPMKIKLINEGTSSKSMSLTTKIDTSNVITAENSEIKVGKGDLLLFQGKELILINEETTITNENGDYIKLGKTQKSERLFDLITKSKRIMLWNVFNYDNHRGKVKPYGKYNSIMNYLSWKIFTFFCFLLI